MQALGRIQYNNSLCQEKKRQPYEIMLIHPLEIKIKYIGHGILMD